MDNKLQITCPRCKKKFLADEIFKEHLEQESKKQKKSIEEDLEKKHSLKSKKLEEENLLLKNQKKIDAGKIDEKVKLKLEQQLKEERKELQKENKYIIKGEVRKMEARKDKESEIEKRRLVDRITKIEENSRKKITEMEKMAKQKSVEVQGEVQEELIQDFLRDKFPDDDVEEIKKGAKGGDCILTINSKDKTNIARIYIESKDRGTFQEEWTNKLLNDMKKKNISYGILISTTLPKNMEKNIGFSAKHGGKIIVIPMDYRIIHLMISSIRSRLIQSLNQNKEIDVPRDMKKLWDHISGPAFQIPLRTIYSNMKKMNTLIEKEKNFYEKNIANKENVIENMGDDLRDLVLSFRRVAGNILPENLLESDKKIEE